ncbi:MAG: methyltransferase type 12 [Ktedonobacterales bacterium]
MSTLIPNSISTTHVLDDATTMIDNGDDISAASATLCQELYETRRSLPAAEWQQFATVACREHPLYALVSQDPLTARAFAKPRGYAGDAVMLDLIYAAEDDYQPAEIMQSTPLGQQVYRATSQFPAAQAVRNRRRLIIEKLDEVAQRVAQPRVFSLACGHLREAQHSSAVREGRLGRYVAMDQDAESLAVVERESGPFGVEAMHGSVRDILRGRFDLGGFDFVYAAGLYDYLATPLAQRLTEKLFAMLNPRGHLLLANYLPGIVTAGYMEAFMDWWLIYRSGREILQLAETLPEPAIESLCVYSEATRNIGFLEITRKA